MKKVVTTSLFIFIAIVAGIFLVKLIEPRSQPTASQTGSVDLIATSTPKTYSLVEVAKHTDANSCWQVINGKVYDVTDEIYAHPGGADAILENCGTDATVAFDTMGKPRGRGHNASARELLQEFYIGDLK